MLWATLSLHGYVQMSGQKGGPFSRVFPQPIHMMKVDPVKGFHSSPEIIRLAVMLYVRFPLSLRNVELDEVAAIDRCDSVGVGRFVAGGKFANGSKASEGIAIYVSIWLSLSTLQGSQQQSRAKKQRQCGWNRDR